MDQRKINILVTGANGFVGSYLLRHLLGAGYENIRISIRKSSQTGLIDDLLPKLEVFESDINDIKGMSEAIEGMDWVLHTAALVSFVESEKKLMHKTNVDGTANVVNICLEKGIKKLGYISSVAALGRKKNGQKIDENTKWVPGSLNTNYAVTKYLAELEVWRGQQEGLNVSVINPSLILGAGYWDSGSINIIKQVAGKLPYYPPGKTNIVDVRDVAAMMILIMESDFSGQRFICSAGHISYQELFENMANVIGSKPPVKILTPILASLAWRLYAIKSMFTGMRPSITRESMKTSFHDFEYINKKSREVLAFQYREIEQTIQDSCVAYKSSREKNTAFEILNGI